MGKVSELLNNAIDDFLTKYRITESHFTSTANPHSVTKAQVGLSDVDNVQQAAKSEFDALSDTVENHIDGIASKHSAEHIEYSTESSVKEKIDADKTEFQAHTAGTAAKHSADDVVYDETHSVKEKFEAVIADLVEDASITVNTDHAELTNKDAANQHPITSITGLSEELYGISFSGETTGEQRVELLSDETNLIIADGRFTLVRVPKQVYIYELFVTGYNSDHTVLSGNGRDYFAWKISGLFASNPIQIASFVKERLDFSTNIVLGAGVGEGIESSADVNLEVISSGTTHKSMKVMVTGMADQHIIWNATLKARPMWRDNE